MTDENSKEKYRATAKVVLWLEIQCQSDWGGDCTVNQVSMQAKEEASQMIKAAISGRKNIKISDPAPKVEIEMFFVEKKDDWNER